jgi:hypothetical protein
MAKRRQPARTEREWWALLKSDDSTFIRSMEDWQNALKDPKHNPLKDCDPKVIEHFTKNLQFNNGGLAHADYRQVAKHLNYIQFKQLWAAFGMSMELFEDHNGYRCVSLGTCRVAPGYICTSNC